MSIQSIDKMSDFQAVRALMMKYDMHLYMIEDVFKIVQTLRRRS